MGLPNQTAGPRRALARHLELRSIGSKSREADLRGGEVLLRGFSNEPVDFLRRFPYVQNLSAYQIQPRVTSVTRISNKFRNEQDSRVSAVDPR
jgi:hypothetical protein